MNRKYESPYVKYQIRVSGTNYDVTYEARVFRIFCLNKGLETAGYSWFVGNRYNKDMEVKKGFEALRMRFDTHDEAFAAALFEIEDRRAEDEEILKGVINDAEVSEESSEGYSE